MADSGGSDPFVFKVVSDGYKIVPAMRATQDNVSQQPGSVLHPPFTSGLVASLKVQYCVSADGESSVSVSAPCGSDLRLMDDLLMLHLNALLYPAADPNSDQRLLWYPTGYGQARMLTGVQTLAWADPSFDAPFWTVAFQLACPFPYAVDQTEDDVALTDGGGAVLVPNAGSAPFYPVVQVAGPTSAFTLSNTDTGQEVAYSGTAIGSGHYAEINFFDGTIYLDGSSTDLVDGIDPTLTDYFTIAPDGGSNVSITGAAATVKSNAAWA